MKKTIQILLVFNLLLLLNTSVGQFKTPQKIVISENRHFLQYADGEPFFWMGDTGWLLFQKLNRDEVLTYLKNRAEKGFNVIQCMALHDKDEVNYYGKRAMSPTDPSSVLATPGNDFSDSSQYDYWDHVDYVVDQAARLGIYIAIVPVWGNVVKSGLFTAESAQKYAAFLANRYKDKTNIFWINGGDIRGNIKPEIWNIIGSTIKKIDRNHLITFHPFGRSQSSEWFQNASWLDFNMIQSGHRRYDQETKEGRLKGENNWTFIRDDYAKLPTKPTLDGEPSYEKIPQGLHDSIQPYWSTGEIRRYAWWAVFAGALGHTYGDNAVMQMFKPNSGAGAYFPKNYWYEAINDEGAGQMQYLKKLILSHSYFERVFDSTLVGSKNKIGHSYIVATRGKNYAYVYSWRGENFSIAMGKIAGNKVNASWYNPRNGKYTFIGSFENTGICNFDPPGEPTDGNDWTLVLESRYL